MFGKFGVWEILLIVILIVILFGHNKIPGMMKNLANGINIFKKEMKQVEEKTVVERKPQPEKKKVVKKATKKRVVKKKTTKKK